eukprot:5605779-Prymnesium_polylepis.2
MSDVTPTTQPRPGPEPVAARARATDSQNTDITQIPSSLLSKARHQILSGVSETPDNCFKTADEIISWAQNSFWRFADHQRSRTRRGRVFQVVTDISGTANMRDVASHGLRSLREVSVAERSPTHCS